MLSKLKNMYFMLIKGAKVNYNFIFILYLLIFSANLNAANIPLTYVFKRSILTQTYSTIPTLLSDIELKEYYEIYRLQNSGKYKEAKELIANLTNPLLSGYMDYLRFLKDDYDPSYEELRSWLDKYHDLAVSESVYKMALKKAKNSLEKASLKSPRYFYDRFVPIYLRHDLFAEVASSVDQIEINSVKPVDNNTTKRLNAYLKKGKTLSVKNMLTNPTVRRSLDRDTYDYYASILARSYFLDGEDKQAIEWGKKAIKRKPIVFIESYFYLGLSYYRLKDYDNAQYYFGYVFNNYKNIDSDIAAKGAYWYAKVSLLLGDIDTYYKALQVGSSYIYNFYGILSSEELGVTPNYSWQYIEFPTDSIIKLESYETGKRTFALLQLGLLDWAEQELIFFATYETPLLPKEEENQLLEALMYIAQTTNMPALSYKLAGQNGKYYGLSHLSYPVFFVDLKNGYELDPALLLAIIRRESNFFSGAESLPGAKGLMQLMPTTASSIIEKYNLNYSVSEDLISPKANIDLGQKYLQILMSNPNANNNLIYVIAGYNGGFFNVEKWKEQTHRHPEDPLFFIESIPYYETRNYVKSVLTDYWIYQYKIGTPRYALRSLLEGEQPLYVAISKGDLQKIMNFDYTKFNLIPVNN